MLYVLISTVVPMTALEFAAAVEGAEKTEALASSDTAQALTDAKRE